LHSDVDRSGGLLGGIRASNASMTRDRGHLFALWDQPRIQAILPLRPLWPGFAVNTLFYAGVLWMLFCGPFALRRMIRRRRGRCAHCNYPIGQSPVCTECGADVGKRQLAMGNGKASDE
jgi:hypothetical protein